MSSYSFAFLFDDLTFERKISPAIDELIKGNSSELERIALGAAKGNSEIWNLVEFSRIPRYDNDSKKGSEDVIDAGVLPWLLLVISNYCSEYTQNVSFEILRETGTSEKPLGILLTKISPKFVPADYVDENFDINKCPLYWLSFDDIEKIKNILQTNLKLAKSHESDRLITLMDSAIASNNSLILGHWFN